MTVEGEPRGEVEIEWRIQPEPSELERRVVERALAAEAGLRVPGAYASPWRRSGLPPADGGEPSLP